MDSSDASTDVDARADDFQSHFTTIIEESDAPSEDARAAARRALDAAADLADAAGNLALAYADIAVSAGRDFSDDESNFIGSANMFPDTAARVAVDAASAARPPWPPPAPPWPQAMLPPALQTATRLYTAPAIILPWSPQRPPQPWQRPELRLPPPTPPPALPLPPVHAPSTIQGSERVATRLPVPILSPRAQNPNQGPRRAAAAAAPQPPLREFARSANGGGRLH